jgi:hypothetical protein
MAFSPTVTLQDKNGTVKKISADKVMRDMSNDAMWYSSSSTLVASVPLTLSNTNKEWAIWQRGNWIKIKFEADSGFANGQGLNITTINTRWSVDALLGTVYIVRAQNIDLADSKIDIYANANRITASVGDLLYDGDAILCSSTSAFTIKIETPSDALVAYDAYGIVQAGIADS